MCACRLLFERRVALGLTRYKRHVMSVMGFFISPVLRRSGRSVGGKKPGGGFGAQQALPGEPENWLSACQEGIERGRHCRRLND